MSDQYLTDALPDEMKSSAKAAAIKAGAGFTIGGVTLSDWVVILTLIYFVLQIGLLAMKYWEELPKFWASVRAWWSGKGAP